MKNFGVRNDEVRGFKGEWLRFGSQEFPNWESVLEYL